LENNIKDLKLLAKELLSKILNSETDARPTMKVNSNKQNE